MVEVTEHDGFTQFERIQAEAESKSTTKRKAVQDEAKKKVVKKVERSG